MYPTSDTNFYVSYWLLCKKLLQSVGTKAHNIYCLSQSFGLAGQFFFWSCLGLLLQLYSASTLTKLAGLSFHVVFHPQRGYTDLTWLWQCHTPGYRPKRNACLCTLRGVYKNIYIALFIKITNYKKPKCLSTVEWIHKLQCIYIMEIYMTMQMKELVVHNNLEKSHKHIIEQKKPDTKECILCMNPCI